MGASEDVTLSERIQGQITGRAPLEGERINLADEMPVRLGTLNIEPALRRVSREDGGEEIVEPRVMQVLVALVRARSRILARDELIMSCWDGIIVGDDSLNRVIGRLRKLANGIGEGVFAIETVAKVGYRIVPKNIPTQMRHADRSPHQPSICVLPFVNMSDDPQQEYFSAGITEDITTDLGKVSSLLVTARTTAFALREKNLDIPELARRLNVGHVLEGSVRKADGRVRITAQLIDAASGGHVWAERYDRNLNDIFALQTEISQAVVDALKLKLLPEEKEAIEHRGTTNVEAYNFYLIARQYYLSGREGNLRSLEAIVRMCARSTELDPDYARAWALMAAAQSGLHFLHGAIGERGLAAVERALCLDPKLAEAHAVKARHLWQEQKWGEALEEVQLALRLDPESWAANSGAGRLHYEKREFEAVIRHLEKATTLREPSGSDMGLLMSSYTAIGDSEGKLRTARMILARTEEALAEEYVNVPAIGCGVSALAILGDRQRARALIERGLLMEPDNDLMRYNFACGMSVHLKDADTALDLLGPVFARMSERLLRHIEIDPDLDPIRSDPRFQAMVSGAWTRLAAG